jgi:hypothetical protein
MIKSNYLLATILVKIALLGFAGFLFAHEEVSEKKSNPIATFQIPKNGDMIVLPVTLGKKEYPFWLDTGASVNIIDKSLKNELGNFYRTREFFTAKDKITVETHEPPSLRLGSVSLQTNGEVVCSDLAKISKVFGSEICGVLGMDSLRHFIVQIDFDNGELKLYSSDSKAEAEWGEPLALRYNWANCPEIVIRSNDEPFTFMIDTGCSGISIDNDIFQRLYSKRQLCIIGKTLCSTTFGQKSENATYMLNRFSLGAFQHSNLICDQGNGNRLGLSYLSRYMVTFDFPHNTIYLKTGNRYQEVENDNMSGLHILREEKDTMIDSVDTGSQGELADIQPGDKLLRVDGQEALQNGLFDLRNIFKSGDGKKIHLSISRNGKEMEKTVVLKEKTPQWDEATKE